MLAEAVDAIVLHAGEPVVVGADQVVVAALVFGILQIGGMNTHVGIAARIESARISVVAIILVIAALGNLPVFALPAIANIHARINRTGIVVITRLWVAGTGRIESALVVDAELQGERVSVVAVIVSMTATRLVKRRGVHATHHFVAFVGGARVAVIAFDRYAQALIFRTHHLQAGGVAAAVARDIDALARVRIAVVPVSARVLVVAVLRLLQAISSIRVTPVLNARIRLFREAVLQEV